jgi:hypothetical protein
MAADNELESMCNELVVAYLKVLLSGGTAE